MKNKEDFAILITNKSVTVTTDGNSKTVRKEDASYGDLIRAIKNQQWDKISRLLSPEDAVLDLSNGQMSVIDSQVTLKTSNGDFLVPSGLNDKILLHIEKKLPFEPLIKFALNLSENPSKHSVDQLFTFLEANHFAITDSGNFIAYKKVRADFKDVRTGTMDNSIGLTVSMPRDQVCSNAEVHCSIGLHVANYNYAHNIYNGDITLLVEVNPKNVVSVPNDYDCAKMRVCEYRVLSLAKEELKDHLYKDGPFDDTNVIID